MEWPDGFRFTADGARALEVFEDGCYEAPSARGIRVRPRVWRQELASFCEYDLREGAGLDEDGARARSMTR